MKVIVYAIVIYAGFKYGIIQDMVHALADIVNTVSKAV
mgnify:CR=1 FL=1